MQLLKNNIGIALIALLVTLLIKGYVYVIDPPTSIEMNLPVQVRNLPENLSVTSIIPSRVELEIRGSKSRIDQIRERDFKVIADCSDIEGVESMMIDVKLAQRKPQGVRCTIIPEQVNVVVGRYERKFLAPEMRITGDISENRVISTIEGLPETVKVSGGSQELERLDKVIYELDVEHAEDSWSTDVEFTPVDMEGNPIRFLQVDPDYASITVSLSKHQASRTVPVVPSVTGVPALNYAVISQEVDPLYVQITGSPESIMGVTNVNTSTINITDATESISRSVNLISPKSGIIVEPDSVRVDIEIRQVTAQRTVEVLVDIRGRENGFEYELEPSSVSILIQGPVTKIRTLDLKLVKSTFNVATYDVGTHKVPLNYPDLPSEIALLKMEPMQAQLTVNRIDANSEND